MGQAKPYLAEASAPAVRPQGGAAPDALIGRVFNNRFRIHALLAVGGMGKVYRAEQIPLGRTVALKVLHVGARSPGHGDFHRRFFLEAAVAAQMTQVNSVTVYDFGQTDDGIYYLAMEYLQGKSLREALREVAFFPPHRALRIAHAIACAVGEAHRLGAIHRDLKPANIFLLERNGQADFVKVLDFGLVKSVAANEDASRITQPGKFLGSPGYMAPEQIRGRPLDGRCDIYALGVILYEMLVGRPPFCRRNAFEMMSAHVHDRLTPMHVAQPRNAIPPQLEQLVQRCLQKDAADRFASMDALREEMVALLGGDAPITLVGALPDAALPQASLPARLSDHERSGWSVVRSRGLLAAEPQACPSPAFTAAAAAGAVTCGAAPAEAPTQMLPTQAMGVETWTPSSVAPALPAPAPAPAPGLPPRPPVASLAPAQAALCVLLALALGLGGWLALRPWRQGRMAQRPVQLQVRSEPAGAQVFLDDAQICAATPCEVSLPPSRRRTYLLHLRKPGFIDYVGLRRPYEGRVLLDARLDSALHPPLESISNSEQLPRPQ